MLSSPLNLMAVAWGWRSAVQSWSRMVAVCGPHPTTDEARRFISLCQPQSSKCLRQYDYEFLRACDRPGETSCSGWFSCKSSMRFPIGRGWRCLINHHNNSVVLLVDASPPKGKLGPRLHLSVRYHNGLKASCHRGTRTLDLRCTVNRPKEGTSSKTVKHIRHRIESPKSIEVIEDFVMDGRL